MSASTKPRRFCIGTHISVSLREESVSEKMCMSLLDEQRVEDLWRSFSYIREMEKRS